MAQPLTEAGCNQREIGEDMDEERFLPDIITCPSIPEDWTPEESVLTIKKLTVVVKPKVADIINEFWIAHEQIVKKKAKGWTWERFCEEAGYARKTPLEWFKKYSLPYVDKGKTLPKKIEVTNDTSKQTKPETKAKLEEIAEAIKIETINDDDLRLVGTALAEAIKKGAAPRVGTQVATAVRESFKKGVKPELKPIDNFYRLKKYALALAEGLNFWADGTMKPETEDEGIYARIVMDAAPSIIVHYARMGVNVEGILRTFANSIDPYRKEKH
jgi:hypothetical protein